MNSSLQTAGDIGRALHESLAHPRPLSVQGRQPYILVVLPVPTVLMEVGVSGFSVR